MYIRLKIFERKEDDKLNIPLASYEINGDHALKLIILYLLDFGYSQEIKAKVKEIIERREF